ncbi:MAG: hypothetical protein ABW135_15515 [Thermoleophilaceae bacterium]
MALTPKGPRGPPGHRRTREQRRQNGRLRRKLARVEQTRLQPLG